MSVIIRSLTIRLNENNSRFRLWILFALQAYLYAALVDFSNAPNLDAPTTGSVYDDIRYAIDLAHRDSIKSAIMAKTEDYLVGNDTSSFKRAQESDFSF